jgi:hypothetical protein
MLIWMFSGGEFGSRSLGRGRVLDDRNAKANDRSQRGLPREMIGTKRVW